MENKQNDGDGKKDLDDSGCVQDASPFSKQTDLENAPAGLMDLSDDVLLCILRYCTPRDLKALGFTCPRLGRLIRDRTLWTYVDARGQPTGRARLRWLLAHALSTNTTELLLHGYAKEARGCLGHVNRKREEADSEMATEAKQAEPTASTSGPEGPGSSRDGPAQIIQMDPLSRLQQLWPRNSNLHTPSRFGGSPSWPENAEEAEGPGGPGGPAGACPGPQFTLTQCMLRQLRTHCRLTSLALQYCNINCNTTGIAHFPPTLQQLSLRGSKCYNLPLDKSYLFNVQDYLPQLECLDLSECEWLEPASLLPLSKLTTLRHLVMRHCYRLSEFVAYASLATRYGFRNLELLDLRGSPVADSEVSALGWLPALQELYMSPAPRAAPRPADHAHYRGEPLPAGRELEPWEVDEPEYFKIKPQTVEPMNNRPNITIDDIEEHIEQLRDYENNICLHGIEYNLCTEGIRKTPLPKSPAAAPAKPSVTIRKVNKECISTDEEVDVMNETSNEAEDTDSKEKPPKKHKLFDKIDEEPGPSPKRTKLNIKPKDTNEASSSSKHTKDKKQKDSDDSDSSDDDDVPLKVLCQNTVDKGASTSEKSNDTEKSPKDPNTPKCKKPDEHPKECTCNERKVYEFVRFRQNMDPVIVRRDPAEVEREREQFERDRDRGDRDRGDRDRGDRDGGNRDRGDRDRSDRDRGDRDRGDRDRGDRDRGDRDRGDREREGEENQNREVRPRAHVLYVNVGQQLHTVYRLSLHNEPPIFYSFAGNSHLRFRPNVGNIFYTPPTPHLDATSLVSDSAIRRFGRADVDDVAYVHIGPRSGDPGARPNRSRLRILSITGFRNITDRSLVHLATAAPDLVSIDFTDTRVTAQGVENFKSLRPNCEVKFSNYVEEDE